MMTMELVQELFFTASMAILFSFLVAKLVSVALSGDGARAVEFKSGNGKSLASEDFGERLTGRGFESESRVVFVKEGTNKVDEFAEEESTDVDDLNIQTSSAGKVIVKEIFDLPEKLFEESDRQESKIVDLPENSGECDIGKVVEGNLESIVEAETVENVKVEAIRQEPATDDVVIDDQNDEFREILKSEAIQGGEEKEESMINDEVRSIKSEAIGGDEEKEELMISDEDDWEGIERSELEKDFAAATAFVGDEKSATFGGDVQMQLYGLHKIAVEGPCHEPQPMALKMAARAKWNAWQKLGDMSPETAMEQYIGLVSDRVPGWMEDNALVENEINALKVGIHGTSNPDSSTLPHHQANPTNESEPEPESGTAGVDASGSSCANRVKD